MINLEDIYNNARFCQANRKETLSEIREVITHDNQIMARIYQQNFNKDGRSNFEMQRVLF
jgi:hypothetical protein